MFLILRPRCKCGKDLLCSASLAQIHLLPTYLVFNLNWIEVNEMCTRVDHKSKLASFVTELCMHFTKMCHKFLSSLLILTWLTNTMYQIQFHALKTSICICDRNKCILSQTKAWTMYVCFIVILNLSQYNVWYVVFAG